MNKKFIDHSPDTISNGENDFDVLIVRNRNFLEQLFSKHAVSLRLAFLLSASLLFILLGIAIWIAIGIESAPPALLTVISTMIAALLAVMIKMYDTITTRMGTVDLFINEILGIIRVISSVSLIDVFISMFFMQRIHGFADQARKENYFSIFDKQSSELGFLDRNAVAQTTSFYTFLKGSRDATGGLALWRQYEENNWPEDRILTQKRTDIFNIVYLLFLCLEAAHYALESLVEREDELAAYSRMVDRNIIMAYLFLMDAIEDYNISPMRKEEHLSYLTNRRRKLLTNPSGNLRKEVETQYAEIVKRYETNKQT